MLGETVEEKKDELITNDLSIQGRFRYSKWYDVSVTLYAKDGVLMYHKTKSSIFSSNKLHVIPLGDVDLYAHVEINGVWCETLFGLRARSRDYVFRTASLSDKKRWIRAIAECKGALLREAKD